MRKPKIMAATAAPTSDCNASRQATIPAPYYQDDYVTIYHGDCREKIPLLKDEVDLVLTDPPYGIGDMVSGTMSKARLHKTRYSRFEDSTEYVREVCVGVLESCIQWVARRVILTPGSRCMGYYPIPDSFGCLFSNSAKGMQLWGSMDSQPIFYYGKPHDIGLRIHRCSYEMNEPPSNYEHPCAKPIKVWSRILSDRSDKGHLILDPFMGSGTTLVAAKQLQRKAIGIEIEEKYCEIAAKRCSQEVLALDFACPQREADPTLL